MDVKHSKKGQGVRNRTHEHISNWVDEACLLRADHWGNTGVRRAVLRRRLHDGRHGLLT